ncbi:hypothetical protein DMENIID0001_042750 [Sergentomyia squamirostris]
MKSIALLLIVFCIIVLAEPLQQRHQRTKQARKQVTTSSPTKEAQAKFSDIGALEETPLQDFSAFDASNFGEQVYDEYPVPRDLICFIGPWKCNVICRIIYRKQSGSCDSNNNCVCSTT